MPHRSLLFDLYTDGVLDAAFLSSFRPEPLGPEAREIVDAFRSLSERFPPEELEARGRVPEEALAEMGRIGLFGMSLPREHGGLGLPFGQYLGVVAEMAPVDLALALTSLAHLSIGVQPVVLFGTEEQKARFLGPAARGETIFAYALTEPDVGSDARHIRTSCRLSDDGRHYVLRGQKTYITNANYAGAFTVFAQLEGHRPGHMVALVVERDSEGFTVGRDMAKMGLKASSTAFLRFEDVRVPVENRLGDEGQGFRIAMSVLSYGRLAVCAAGVGLMEASAEAMAKRAASRVQFGGPIGRFELVREKIGRARANAFVGRAMVELAARQLEEDPRANVAVETSHCKLFCTTRAWEALYDAQQVAGGSGYLATNPYEKRLRDFRVATIFEGTTEIHTIYPPLVVARGLGRRLPKRTGGRVGALLSGIFRRLPAFPVTGVGPADRALRLARRKARGFAWRIRAALLRHGKAIAGREFLLRRLTWTSLYGYGLLAGALRLAALARAGGDTAGAARALAAFAAEARAHRPGLVAARTREERAVLEAARD